MEAPDNATMVARARLAILRGANRTAQDRGWADRSRVPNIQVAATKAPAGSQARARGETTEARRVTPAQSRKFRIDMPTTSTEPDTFSRVRRPSAIVAYPVSHAARSGKRGRGQESSTSGTPAY